MELLAPHFFANSLRFVVLWCGLIATDFSHVTRGFLTATWVRKLVCLRIGWKPTKSRFNNLNNMKHNRPVWVSYDTYIVLQTTMAYNDSEEAARQEDNILLYHTPGRQWLL